MYFTSVKYATNMLLYFKNNSCDGLHGLTQPYEYISLIK